MKCESCGATKAGTESWFTPKWTLCYGHGLKVTDLPSISPSELSLEDYILVTDKDKLMSKKVSVGDLIQFLKVNRK